MVSFASLLVACASVAGVVSASPLNATDLDLVLGKRQSTPSVIGTYNGYYYSWWTDGGSQVIYTNKAGGKYSVKWGGGGGNFIGGKGWNPGGPKAIKYPGLYQPNGNSYLAVYRWTQNPLVEYYVGSVTTDGGTYNIYVSMRTNQPSIEGTGTFQQYWSRYPRTQKRTGGTVTMSNHFAASEKASMELGKHSYMIVAPEGYFSSGSSTITVEAPP
ncbi:glycoside hydrolase family 11 protein [Hypoxylon cercidicola]|nr:glycoside hydrolase family 11 protein [Hypoxylon cercidicola]